MTMLGFSADASLYKTREQYQRTSQSFSSSTRMMSPIHPALWQDPEQINLHGCAPGWTDIGGTCWPNPLTEPPGTGSGGGGGLPGEPGGGDEDGGESVPTADLDKPVLFGCSARQLQSKEAQPCLRQQEKDQANGANDEHLHYMECTGKRKGRVVHPKMQCCQGDKEVQVCEDLN